MLAVRSQPERVSSAAGRFKKDLNKSNPLGTGGRIAEAFANLMRSLWQGGRRNIQPTEFKVSLSCFPVGFSCMHRASSTVQACKREEGIHVGDTFRNVKAWPDALCSFAGSDR